jgi:hypothetical protein
MSSTLIVTLLLRCVCVRACMRACVRACVRALLLSLLLTASDLRVYSAACFFVVSTGICPATASREAFPPVLPPSRYHPCACALLHLSPRLCAAVCEGRSWCCSCDVCVLITLWVRACVPVCSLKLACRSVCPIRPQVPVRQRADWPNSPQRRPFVYF